MSLRGGVSRRTRHQRIRFAHDAAIPFMATAGNQVEQDAYRRRMKELYSNESKIAYHTPHV